MYPKLSDEGAKQAEIIIEAFKEDIKKTAEDAISKLYIDVACYIESDQWINYKNHLMDGLKGYSQMKDCYPHDFKYVRKRMLEENKEEITNDIIKDLQEELAVLKDHYYP